jgi:arylsulfatase A-like enzyme
MLRTLLPRLSRIVARIDVAAPARVVLNAPAMGVLYLGLLYLSFVTTPLVPADQVLLGGDAKEIADYVAVRFGAEIRAIGLTLGGIAIALGALLGVVTLLLLVLRDRIQARAPARRTGFHAAFQGLVGSVALHAFALLYSMSRWPQLYSGQFWTQGGMRAWIERTTTDELHTQGLLVVGLALLALFLLGRPWRLGALLARARAVALPAMRAVLAATGAYLALRPPAPSPPPRLPPLPTATDAPATTPSPAPGQRLRSVLVIASDGLRPDRLRPEIAPHLAALGERGVRFERAYVDIPRTMSSWATLLTGLHPHHHGVRVGFPRAEDTARPLDSVPARLRAAGYQTAVISDYVGEVFARVDFGFDRVDVPPPSFPSLLREQAVERAVPLLPFLQSRLGRAAIPEVALWSGAADPRFVARSANAALQKLQGGPFFVTVFFSTTHFPYAAPAPYNARFTRPDYRGPFRYDKTVSANVRVMPNAEDVTQIRGLYDGAVAAVDDAVGTILDEVTRLGLADDLLIVLTSDHGEVLFEHDRWHGHGDHLFGDQGTHIPLVILDPRLPARAESAVVASVDLAPTLYGLLGVAPPERLDGRSLVPAMHGEPLEPRPVFAETELLLGANPGLPSVLHMPPPSLARLFEVDTAHGNLLALKAGALETNLLSRHRMVRDAHWKLLYMPTPKGVAYQLFDLDHDPDELTDVLRQHPAEASRLARQLWRWMLEDPRMKQDGAFLVPKGGSAPVP